MTAAIGVALAIVLLEVSSASSTGDGPVARWSETSSGAADELTPVTATTLGSSSAPVLGTDERWHVVYELQLANVRPQPSVVESIDVLDADDESRVVQTFSGAGLQNRLRTLASRPTTSLELDSNVARLVLIELAFDRRADVPRALVHRLHVLAVPFGGRAPAPVAYTAATFPLDRGVTVVGRPLAGEGWIATNGCCSTDGVHRQTVLPIGALHAAQRFAIDWMRLDHEGRLVDGDPSDVRSYTAYGADILAVAGGTVVSTMNTLDDQVPGQLPDPSTITLENILGNHVVVRHGDGRYATYAHMQKGSVTVEVGDRVRPRQTLGKLGNTGNTSAPHLHFQITDGRSVLGSSGVPFVVDRFKLQGQVDPQRLATATTLEGTWNEGPFPEPERTPRSDSARPQHRRLRRPGLTA